MPNGGNRAIRERARGAHPVRGKGRAPPTHQLEGYEPSFSLTGADSRHVLKGDSYVRRPSLTISSQPRPVQKARKDLQYACKSGDPAAIRDWAARWVETLARLRGQAITSEVQKEIQADIDRVERAWHKSQKSNEPLTRCTLTGAQFFVARCHGFATWPKFVKHLEALNTVNSTVSKFEMAVDAIVSGDAATLSKLLRSNPELARTRSTREHRSTLLHYISANGVEDFRQKTPKNIIEIAKLLLDAAPT